MAWLARLGPVGLLPAPGTWGSLCGLVIAALLAHKPWYPIFLGVLFTVTLGVVHHALTFYRDKDPSEIVLDEFFGCLLIFLNLPVSLSIFMVGFCLFRFFDITKCCGGSWFEACQGAWGVVLDDCYAAFLTGLIIRFLLYCRVI